MLAVPTSGREPATPRMASFQYVYVQTRPFQRFLHQTVLCHTLRFEDSYVLKRLFEYNITSTFRQAKPNLTF